MAIDLVERLKVLKLQIVLMVVWILALHLTVLPYGPILMGYGFTRSFVEPWLHVLGIWTVFGIWFAGLFALSIWTGFRVVKNLGKSLIEAGLTSALLLLAVYLFVFYPFPLILAFIKAVFGEIIWTIAMLSFITALILPLVLVVCFLCGLIGGYIAKRQGITPKK